MVEKIATMGLFEDRAFLLVRARFARFSSSVVEILIDWLFIEKKWHCSGYGDRNRRDRH